jgi:alpha-glucosidase
MLRADPSSIVHLYRRLLAARRASPALRGGSWTPLEAPAGVLAYRREHGGDTRVVLVNFTARTLDVAAAGARVVEVASDGIGDGAAYAGTLRPDQALILR